MPPEKILVLNVYGMHCQGCVNNVTNALTSLKGVGDVQVNLEEKKVTIMFDGDRASLGHVKKAITKSGYLVGEVTEQP